MWWRSNIKITLHLTDHFVQVDNILREREESVDRQRRLAAKTARLRRSLRWDFLCQLWASVSVLVAGCCIMGCWTVQNTDILMSWILWITYYRIGRLSTVWQKPWSQECHYDVGDISDQAHHNIIQQEGKKLFWCIFWWHIWPWFFNSLFQRHDIMPVTKSGKKCRAEIINDIIPRNKL